MENNYLCPECRAYLNACDKIIFGAKKENNQFGVILLHKELGNYSVEQHPEFKTDKGERVQFFCPACHANLTTDINKNLAHVVLQEKDGKEFDIYFSQIAGEKLTYQIVGETMKVYGDDSDNYLDFFSLSMMT